MAYSLPTFSNEAVSELYTLQYTESEFATIQEILTIGEALIPELELVVNYGIEHIDDFTDDNYNSAVSHALLMLSELRATSAFPTIEKFMRQSEEDIEFWLGDTNFTIMPRILAYCGSNAVDKLLAMFYDTSLTRTHKQYIGDALAWIGRLFPEKRERIVEIFHSYLRSDVHKPILPEQMQSRPYGGFPMAQNDEDFPVFICITLENLGYHELREDIEWFWAEGKAFPGITELSEIQKGFDEPSNVEKTELLSGEPLSAVYAWIDKTFYQVRNYSHKYRPNGVPGGLVKKDYTSTTLVRTEPKIGRNDPCPVDGVKKFKKCCGAKGHSTCQKM